MIANKHYPWAPDFIPGEDPVSCSSPSWIDCSHAGRGYPISDQYSGFVATIPKVRLYQNYVNQDGQEAADRYSRQTEAIVNTKLVWPLIWIDTSGDSR